MAYQAPFEMQRIIAFALVEEHGEDAEAALDAIMKSFANVGHAAGSHFGRPGTIRKVTPRDKMLGGFQLEEAFPVNFGDMGIALRLSVTGTLSATFTLAKGVRWVESVVRLKGDFPETMYMAAAGLPLCRSLGHRWVDDRVLTVKRRSTMKPAHKDQNGRMVEGEIEFRIAGEISRPAAAFAMARKGLAARG